MRILQVNNYHFIKGGADRVYFNTCKLLENNGHIVANFSSINPDNFDSVFAKHFIHLNDNRQSNILGKFKSVKNYLYNKTANISLDLLIKEFKPDIAHLHLYYGGLSSSILKVLKNNNVPIVQTIHDYRLLCPANAFLDKRNQICEKCKNRFFLQCSIYKCLENNIFYSSILTAEAYIRKFIIDPLDYVDHFIFVSKFSQGKHIDFNKRFSDKSSLLYNFTFIPKKSLHDQDRSFLFYFGRLSKEKGLLTLLDAIKNTNLNLKIAGSGPLQKYIENFASNFTNIDYLGYKSGKELENLINHSSYIIVPSEWYENNPMTVLEAFAHGRPVIGSDIGGIPEIVIDGKTGFLFESRSKDGLISKLKEAESLGSDDYSDLVEAALSFAELNFSPQSHYKNLMQIYSKVLKK
jgi:glycosyltransferase involved in cell wall biosynthesis